jgi:hypothetical protein
MDRRKLILGSGAAAVATTLGAVTGATAPAQAAPARTRFRITSTADHARLVLEEVKVDLGLVNPDGVARRYDECYVALTKYPFPAREPDPAGLEAWIRRRMMDLAGTDSYAEAGTKIPETRTLLAFSLLAYSQNQDKGLPEVDPGMPVPPVFEKLEPDFLPVLLRLVKEKRESSREFAAALDATSALLDRIVAEKLRDLPGDKDGKSGGGIVAQANPTPGDGLNLALGVLVIMAVVYWVKRELKL